MVWHFRDLQLLGRMAHAWLQTETPLADLAFLRKTTALVTFHGEWTTARTEQLPPIEDAWPRSQLNEVGARVCTWLNDYQGHTPPSWTP